LAGAVPGLGPCIDWGLAWTAGHGPLECGLAYVFLNKAELYIQAAKKQSIRLKNITIVNKKAQLNCNVP
jgi:hypothetical protein